MNNFKFYVQELKKMFAMYNDYMIDSFITTDNDIGHQEYLVPEKTSEVKKRRASKDNVITVHRNSSAYNFFQAEYRENRMSEDFYGNYLVPGSDYFSSSKTR